MLANHGATQRGPDQVRRGSHCCIDFGPFPSPAVTCLEPMEAEGGLWDGVLGTAPPAGLTSVWSLPQPQSREKAESKCLSFGRLSFPRRPLLSPEGPGAQLADSTASLGPSLKGDRALFPWSVRQPNMLPRNARKSPPHLCTPTPLCRHTVQAVPLQVGACQLAPRHLRLLV